MTPILPRFVGTVCIIYSVGNQVSMGEFGIMGDFRAIPGNLGNFRIVIVVYYIPQVH